MDSMSRQLHDIDDIPRLGLTWLRAWMLVRSASSAIMIQVSSGSSIFIDMGESEWWR
jgi:hypothetical protein